MIAYHCIYCICRQHRAYLPPPLHSLFGCSFFVCRRQHCCQHLLLLLSSSLFKLAITLLPCILYLAIACCRRQHSLSFTPLPLSAAIILPPLCYYQGLLLSVLDLAAGFYYSAFIDIAIYQHLLLAIAILYYQLFHCLIAPPAAFTSAAIWPSPTPSFLPIRLSSSLAIYIVIYHLYLHCQHFSIWQLITAFHCHCICH